jgi:ppGpp synthetase/RelA/SpoT-type nucleotidyltranferase
MRDIDAFVEEYRQSLTFYEALTRKAAQLLEMELAEKGIKAIVSYRTKKEDSLREKVEKRHLKKQYSCIEDIRNDITDICGLRVALYFPTDRDRIKECIQQVFNINITKVFPKNPYQPNEEKRFSGYWATHYKAHLKEPHAPVEVPSHISTGIEIQVASLLMLAWSEVEHDLIYKPLGGTASPEETEILDQINGLVLIGEIALSRLQKAYLERKEKEEME